MLALVWVALEALEKLFRLSSSPAEIVRRSCISLEEADCGRRTAHAGSELRRTERVTGAIRWSASNSSFVIVSFAPGNENSIGSGRSLSDITEIVSELRRRRLILILDRTIGVREAAGVQLDVLRGPLRMQPRGCREMNHAGGQLRVDCRLQNRVTDVSICVRVARFYHVPGGLAPRKSRVTHKNLAPYSHEENLAQT